MTDIAISNINPYLRAFLLTIQRAEGTYRYSNPYHVLFGGDTFTGYSRHPNIRIPFYNPATGKNDYSTAAGAYQINKPTFDSLGGSTFTPSDQDLMAIRLLQRNGAYPFIIAGDLDRAINKASITWASLPGSTARQPIVSMEKLKDYFYTVVNKVGDNTSTLLFVAVIGIAIYRQYNSKKIA